MEKTLSTLTVHKTFQRIQALRNRDAVAVLYAAEDALLHHAGSSDVATAKAVNEVVADIKTAALCGFGFVVSLTFDAWSLGWFTRSLSVICLVGVLVNLIGAVIHRDPGLYTRKLLNHARRLPLVQRIQYVSEFLQATHPNNHQLWRHVIPLHEAELTLEGSKHACYDCG